HVLRSVISEAGCLTYKHPNTFHCFRIYRETLSRFSCAASATLIWVCCSDLAGPRAFGECREQWQSRSSAFR
ncbi:hypothetical protein ABLN72_03730, partial [Mycobacterium tuberculosis]